MTAKERKSVLLRLDPEVHEALTRWAADELRSANAQIEFLLRRALWQAGRLPKGVRTDAAALPRRGRPPRDADAPETPSGPTETDVDADAPSPNPHEETP